MKMLKRLFKKLIDNIFDYFLFRKKVLIKLSKIEERLHYVCDPHYMRQYVDKKVDTYQLSTKNEFQRIIELCENYKNLYDSSLKDELENSRGEKD